MALAYCLLLTYLAVRDKAKDFDVVFDIPSTIAIPFSPDTLFERPVSFFLNKFLYKYWQLEWYNGVISGPGRAPVRNPRR